MNCPRCSKTFLSLKEGLQHCQKVHGMTRQQAQNERAIHNKKTRAAILRTARKIEQLENDRSKYSGRKLKDIDKQIAQYRRAVLRLSESMGAWQ